MILFNIIFHSFIHSNCIHSLIHLYFSCFLGTVTAARMFGTLFPKTMGKCVRIYFDSTTSEAGACLNVAILGCPETGMDFVVFAVVLFQRVFDIVSKFNLCTIYILIPSFW